MISGNDPWATRSDSKLRHREISNLAPCFFRQRHPRYGSIWGGSYYVQCCELVATMTRSQLHWGPGHGRPESSYAELHKTYGCPYSKQQTSCNHCTKTTPLVSPTYTIVPGKATTPCISCLPSADTTPSEHLIRCTLTHTVLGKYCARYGMQAVRKQHASATPGCPPTTSGLSKRGLYSKTLPRVIWTQWKKHPVSYILRQATPPNRSFHTFAEVSSKSL